MNGREQEERCQMDGRGKQEAIGESRGKQEILYIGGK